MTNHYQKIVHHKANPCFLRDWEQAVEDAYYPLQITLPNEGQGFMGNIQCWHLPTISLSRLQSTPIAYERLKPSTEADDSFLMAISLHPSIFYSTDRVSDLEFKKGEYVLQHCSEKYRFECRESAKMWVIRLPGKILRQIIRDPEKLCGYSKQKMHHDYLDFLVEYLNLVRPKNLSLTTDNEPFLRIVEQQIIDICLSVLQRDYVNVASSTTLTEQIHLQNIKKQAMAQLSDPDLKPENLAKQNRMSIRYFYLIFQNQQESFNQWLNSERLKKAHGLLLNQPQNTVLQIALQCGFSNQSHFAQCFKKQYGISPSALKQKKSS